MSFSAYNQKPLRRDSWGFYDGSPASLWAGSPGPTSVQQSPVATSANRNDTEHWRLQKLQLTTRAWTVPRPTSLRDKWDHWMINDGSARLFMFVWVILHLLLLGFGAMNFALGDRLSIARNTFGVTYVIARSAALVLQVDVAFILLPVCRNFITLLRHTPLNQGIIPLDKSMSFHKATGWAIVAASIIHIVAHMVNFAQLALLPVRETTTQRIVLFVRANFTTGPGATGWIMTIVLAAMVSTASKKTRDKRYELFWYTHHLFIIFFVCWQLHGMFCMIPQDREPKCSWNTTGVFWRFWLVGGVIWTAERILREVRSRHRTYIHKVVQHPSNVVELQIKKTDIRTRPGQYIYISCPEISYFQWHPFTLTSAPEEDYISVHIHIAGNFTRELAHIVGCDFDSDAKPDLEYNDRHPLKPYGRSAIVNSAANPINRVLPRIMVDGPFGSASEDFLNYETVLLVAAGIGVTPFASILKSIWYRMNNFADSKSTRLSKVYFVWVIRDFGSAEWFHSLLRAIEDQDSLRRIEINIYLTAKLKEDDMHYIMVHEIGAETDAITSLRAPTHFGRPNWDRIFGSLLENHGQTDVGVFCCGPPQISKQLHAMCNKYSSPEGTRFFYGKGTNTIGHFNQVHAEHK
ncbi:hypothetical protein K474DRAFT_568109 [Panus rudis PR-1116 ss-1]|nr:hypothetical protein K474DRAFT_568109 [Panus rudis PR-1116 ss-1]